jgi:hypothetical protein
MEVAWRWHGGGMEVAWRWQDVLSATPTASVEPSSGEDNLMPLSAARRGFGFPPWEVLSHGDEVRAVSRRTAVSTAVAAGFLNLLR